MVAGWKIIYRLYSGLLFELECNVVVLPDVSFSMNNMYVFQLQRLQAKSSRKKSSSFPLNPKTWRRMKKRKKRSNNWTAMMRIPIRKKKK